MSYILYKLKKFRDVKLKVWKKSRNFVKHIYELTSKLPDAKKNCLKTNNKIIKTYKYLQINNNLAKKWKL